MTTDTSRRTQETPAGLDTGAGGLLDVMRSEWTKLWSLRSTCWTLLAMFVLTACSSALASWGTLQAPWSSGLTADPTNVALESILFGQLPLVVLGVMIISGEYATGGIRPSLTAVPARVRFLTAKTVIFAFVALVGGVITSLTAFFIGMAFFAGHGEAVSLGDPNVLRAVLGGGLLLATSGLLGYAVGALVRRTAPAITISVALLFVVPLVLQTVPATAVQGGKKYFLGLAGERLTHVVAGPAGVLGPWEGYGVFLAEVLVLLVLGSVLVVRRDA